MGGKRERRVRWARTGTGGMGRWYGWAPASTNQRLISWYQETGVIFDRVFDFLPPAYKLEVD